VTRDRWGAPQWFGVGLCLLAWALRLFPFFESPLHPDEALYGYWGLLVGGGRDPWLIRPAVYKPPFLPYLIAVLQLVLGRAAFVPRIPGLMAGVAAVPLVGALARGLYRDVWTGVSAAAALTVFPFAVAFSGSAFPDSLMVTLGLAACAAAARQRGDWTGLLVGTSFATKQTGLVWLPAAVGILLATSRDRAGALRALLLGFAVPTAVTFAWDGLRVVQGGHSFWSVGVVGYGGLRLIWPHEVWPRLRTWLELAASLLDSPAMVTVLVLGGAVLFGEGLMRRRRTRDGFSDVLLTVFCVTYVCLHWLIAFPTWRRYLLPVIPPAAVLLGRFARRVGTSMAPDQGLPGRGALAAMVLVVVLLVPAVEASAGWSSGAEDRSVYAGVDEVTRFLSNLDEGSVVYHHWLGWHYHYALFDAPVYLAYWPTPAWLARDVQVFGSRDPRYVAFPPWESSDRVRAVLTEVGYRLEPVLASAGEGERPFIVYHIAACEAE